MGDEVVAFSPGDKVFAAVSVGRNGTHAEYTCDYPQLDIFEMLLASYHWRRSV